MKYIPLIILIVSIAIGIYVYPKLPEIVASHWDSQGNVNGYMNRFWGAFLMPIITIGSYLLMLLFPKIDPKAANIAKSRKQFDIFLVGFVGFLFWLYLLTIAWNLGYKFNFVLFLLPAFAILFYIIGYLIENMESNYSIGIRTPWTLASPEVWKKTHALGGKLFKASAIITLLSMVVWKYSFIIFISSIILGSLYLVVYSYLEFRRNK